GISLACKTNSGTRLNPGRNLNFQILRLSKSPLSVTLSALFAHLTRATTLRAGRSESHSPMCLRDFATPLAGRARTLLATRGQTFTRTGRALIFTGIGDSSL